MWNGGKKALMTDERSQAEAAFDALSLPRSVSEPRWPPVSRRIREAREQLGLSESVVAAKLGLLPTEYQDVEFHDDEAFTSFSLKQLRALGEVLRLPLPVMLFGPGAEPVPLSTSFSEIARLIVNHAASLAIDLDELSNLVGWELEPIVRDPATLADLNLDGLRSICAAIGVDWVSALEEKGIG
jgi:transcriptional regulator with XRE-family HTH domain